MPKVLIIGPSFFNFVEACRYGFEKNGWTAFTEEYDNPVHPFKGLWKLRHKLSRHKERVRAENRDRYQPHITKRFFETNPDLVFALNADMLTESTLDLFRTRSKVAVWMFDTIQRVKVSQSHAYHADAFFCYDMEDVNWYAAKGKKVHFLPQACDTETYHPLEGVGKSIDLLFVGTIYTSGRRKRILNMLAERFKDKRILFVGECVPFVKQPLRSLFRRNRAVFTNRNVESTEANLLYNKARVVLNIHSEQQKEGANPRLFEICGSGSYQICDSNPYIDSLFKEGEVGLYHTEEELVELVERALREENSKKAGKAYSEVVRNHSYVERMRQVINTLF